MLFSHFKSINCCNYCSLRLSGETNSEHYLNIRDTLIAKKLVVEKEDEHNTKILKRNTCISCLGILEAPFDANLIEEISKKIMSAGYDSDTFNIAITLSVNFQIRAHALWLNLVDEYPDTWPLLFPYGRVAVTVKDVVKWTFVPKIEKQTGKKFRSRSDLSVNIFINHDENEKECSSLSNILPERLKKQSGGNISRKAMEITLSTINNEDFKEIFPCPPPVPNFPAKLESVTMTHASVYVAGRYLKLSRHLPQTPWILAGERKMEGSVQEYICECLQERFSSQSVKFGGSGREDVDVRMLGRGRPFCVELINPRKTVDADHKEMRRLEAIINSTSHSKVAVRDLQTVPKHSLIDLKVGEEKKIKKYEALCVVFGSFELSDIKCPVELSQRTPVRVLHRRPLAVRARTVYEIKITPLHSRNTTQGVSYLKVELKTQAGTYVKEFIHGDFGRTSPDLASLLKAQAMDILALDVKEIELEWPPPVAYNA